MPDRAAPDKRQRRPADPFVWQHIDDHFEQRLNRERRDPRRRLTIVS